MNQDDVKQNLLKLHECAEGFTVAFSGKKGGKINGSYKPLSREIIIHDRNFLQGDTLTDSAPIYNEPMLFYTAMHELAHHIQFTEAKQRGCRCHTLLFHAILDDLAERAEELGLYQPAINAGLQGLIDEAREISAKIAQLQRDLGRVLCRLEGECEQKGARFEDIVKRKVQITLNTARKAFNAAAAGLPGGLGIDIQEAAASERDEGKRRAICAAAQKGKSAGQIKAAGTRQRQPEDETETLIREKERLEKTIEQLSRRLKEIIRRLNSDTGGFHGHGTGNSRGTAA